MRNWIEAVGVDEADLDRIGLGAEEIEALKDGDEPERVEQAMNDQRAGAEIVEDAEPPATVYIAAPVPDYHQRVGALDQRVADAEGKFKSGELTFDEFRAEERNIADERRQLDEARLKSEISREQAEQSAAARWRWECDTFMSQALRDEGIDYVTKPLLWVAFDAEVRRLGQDVANEGKPGRWFLEQAHENVKRQIGIEATASIRSDDAGLVHDHGGDDEFARLDALSGLDLERALSRMSPEQAEKYLRA
jgi:hypothetical protein